MGSNAQSLLAYRSAHQDAPMDVIRDAADWGRVVKLIENWSRDPLNSASGYSISELDEIAEQRGLWFPFVLREWWRLAGKHPIVAQGLHPGNNWLCGPADPDLISEPGLMTIVVEDAQTGGCTGIHQNFMASPDPLLHCTNCTIDQDSQPHLPWFDGHFLETGMNAPQLIHIALLYHLCYPNSLIAPGTLHLDVELPRNWRAIPKRLVDELGLTRYESIAFIGDIYTNSVDVIYWPNMTVACRTEAAAERVRGITPAKINKRR